uniref:Maestro/Maestro-like HEAT-repeats domain-containing protein n=1 Tax=Parascaris equorum TaxID=6256 RepID=A0A914RBX9_PAREQ
MSGCWEGRGLEGKNESGALRAVSFSLFGELGSRIGGSCDAFREQLLVNIVSILLHLNDEEEEVKQMCARCLTLVGGLLNTDAAASLIERELKPDEKCRDYLQFLREFCMILVSTSSRIRANAAHMTGFLLGELTAELRSTVSKELIFAGKIFHRSLFHFFRVFFFALQQFFLKVGKNKEAGQGSLVRYLAFRWFISAVFYWAHICKN